MTRQGDVEFGAHVASHIATAPAAGRKEGEGDPKCQPRVEITRDGERALGGRKGEAPLTPSRKKQRASELRTRHARHHARSKPFIS